MPLSSTVTVQKAPNFAVRQIAKCMSCGRDILSGTDMYSRRFCSVACKESYLL